jgi:uncharacterized protein (DUF362 family)
MAAYITTRLYARNLGLVALAAVGAIAVMAAEHDLHRVDPPFAAFAFVVLLGAVGTSLRLVTPRRWLALFGVAGGFGLVTQSVGVAVGAWSYPSGYGFVFFAFGFGSLTIYGVATLIAHALVPRRLHRPWLGPLLVLLPALMVAYGARGYVSHLSFVAYYAFLVLFALFYSLLARTQTIVAIMLAGAAFGAFAETLGARSTLWRFAGPLPPAWLVLGSWPLEALLHVGFSALLARGHFELPILRTTERPIFVRQPDHALAPNAANSRVIVRRAGGDNSGDRDDKRALLDRAIDDSGFLARLESARVASGKAAADFKVVIKPNFMFMYSKADHSTYTDPELVEHLIDRIVARGFANVTVVEAQSCYGNEFERRDVQHVAQYVGYRQSNYRVVDLTAEKVPYTFPPPLGVHSVGPTWRDADFRVSFAKNKTHTWAVYTLTIKNIYGALAEQNKLLEYHNKREIYYPTIDMLLALPVHFGFIDAYYSSDGPFGIFANKHPKATKTILAGANLLAVDWVGATLMGVDPMASRYMQLAVQAFGAPAPQLDGDGTPYADWVNVPDALMTGVDAAEELYGFTNTMFALMDRMDAVFPRRRHSLGWRIVRALLEPLRQRVMVVPLDDAGQPDRQLR